MNSYIFRKTNSGRLFSKKLARTTNEFYFGDWKREMPILVLDITSAI